jgi:hypothetical protein
MNYGVIFSAGLMLMSALDPSQDRDSDGCNDVKTGQSTKVEMEQTETNQQRLATAQPPPQIAVSLERKNLIERLKRLNTENKIGYVYLMSKSGSVMAFYTISGKVSSLNSLLTTPEQVSRVNGYSFTLPSPDFDGSYGKNPEGIFFFTTSGALVEWSGDYMFSDQPLKMSTAPVLVEQLPAK